jgi:predicted RNA-binding protein with PIN domain
VVRVEQRSRAGGGGALDGERLSPAAETLLRPALEAAVAVARAGEDATPVEAPPPALRPFLHFAKLPRPALVAARRVLDGDDEFRARVVDTVTEGDVGRSGWLFLARPEGWEKELAEMVGDAEDAVEREAGRRAEGDARKRLAGAESARRRAEEAALAAEGDAARATVALAEERHARRAAVEQASKLEARLAQVTTERDRARAAAAEAAVAMAAAGQEIEELRSALRAAEEELARAAPAPLAVPAAGGPALVVAVPEPADQDRDGPSPALDVAGAAAALIDAARAAAALADGLASVATSLQPLPPVPTPGGQGGGSPAPGATPAASGAQPSTERPRARGGQRPMPVALPPGIFDDSVEAADHLVRVPGVAVLVDGYNVSKLGWPEHPIAEQRRRLVDALSEMSARTGAEVAVVFDGADTVWSPQVPSTGRRVRVMFSPPGVEADDVLIARAAELRPFRPVVVASSDNRVRTGTSGAGANVISSPQLLAVLHR